MAKKKTIKLEVVEKRKLEKEIKKAEVLVKKARDKKIKKIKIAIKIKEKAKRNIDNMAEKKQNLKCKAILTSLSRPSKKKKEKELNNLLAKTLINKADMAND